MDRINIRKELGVSEDDVLLLSVGELNENKNHEVVIRALKILERMCEKNIYYMIAGKGSYYEKLKRMAEENGLDNKVKLLGFREDVCKLYAAADIFCFPSKREGLGLAAIEAMASGLPLVTSNVHGINDYSENGVTGYKALPKDAVSIAMGINKLIENADTSQIIGMRNMKVVKKFDVTIITNKMKKLYEENVEI